jgi:heterodisulfide reductase subunit A
LSRVLVIGSGVAGIKASVEAAKRAQEVFLIERSPFIGGEISFLDRQFPTDRCGMCQMLSSSRVQEGEYCLRRSFYNPKVKILTSSELLKLEGEEGAFRATIITRSRGVNEDLCISCGKCMEVCPRSTRDDFDPFSYRKAVYLNGPAPFPPIPAIDWTVCDLCSRCETVCPTGAIDLKKKEEVKVLEVSSIILASGFLPFDPSGLTQYGYGRFANVLTSFEFERSLSPLGKGPIRPSDGSVPKKVAFLFCVGSRDKEWVPCSSACCMIGIKQARILKEISPESKVVLFFMDLRTFGKGYYLYLEEAKRRGIRLVRGRVPKIWEDPLTKGLFIRSFEDQRIKEELFDLVVLVVGQRPPLGLKDLAKSLGIQTDDWGFVNSEGLRTSRKGIYVCGTASGPKDIPDTVIEAQAAAFLATQKLGIPPKARKEEVLQEEEMPKEVGLILCKCGGEIPTEDILKGMGKFFSPICEKKYLCLEKEVFPSDRLWVIGACDPYWFKRRVLERFEEVQGVRWVNVKGILSGEKQGIETVKGLLLAERERLKRKSAGVIQSLYVRPSVLIIGGGLCGMEAAINLSKEGIQVYLVEKEEILGGILWSYPSMRDLLEEKLKEIKQEKIQVCLNSRVLGIEGTPGDFKVKVASSDGQKLIEVGAILLAIGGKTYEPKEYGYGSDPRVLLQREFEELLLSKELRTNGIRRVGVIQCVGSRDDLHPWCSRFCCEEALKNAILFKEKNPEGEIFVFHRDINAYGLRELLYLKAREKGVIFLRCDQLPKPELSDRIRIPFEGESFEVDLLVLSAGEVPREDNYELSRILGLQLTEEGFFKEAEPKFRPLETLKEGIFLAGGCHSPRTFEEAQIQAWGAVQAILGFLSKESFLPRPISFIQERRCSGCGLCVEACPYGVRFLDQEEKVARVKAPLCQGCGVCASICPNGATKLQDFEEEKVMRGVELLLR